MSAARRLERAEQRQGLLVEQPVVYAKRNTACAALRIQYETCVGVASNWRCPAPQFSQGSSAQHDGHVDSPVDPSESTSTPPFGSILSLRIYVSGHGGRAFVTGRGQNHLRLGVAREELRSRAPLTGNSSTYVAFAWLLALSGRGRISNVCCGRSPEFIAKAVEHTNMYVYCCTRARA
jgi:hypothetical protein